MKKNIMEAAARLAAPYYELSDYIFDHPELAYQEYVSSAALVKKLEETGYTVETGIAGMDTAFRAVYQNGEGGPSIGLLVEYDALKGLGHACGHHMQGPCLLLCAEAVKEVLKDQNYRLVVYGTPAEEMFPAKLEMWNAGCFRDIDLALMVHASINTATDLNSLAMVNINVTFHGKNAHAAMFPERGRSAFDALQLVFHGVELMREHVTDDVRMHYAVTDPGGPANVVPKKASAEFVLRSRYSTNYLNEVKERFYNILKGAALMTDTTFEYEEGLTLPNKIPAVVLNDNIMKNAKEVGAPDLSPPRERPGSTDFSAVLYNIPGCCLRIKMVNNCTSHTPEFAAAGRTQACYDAILTAAQTLACTCYDIITDPALLPAIKADYAERRKKFA